MDFPLLTGCMALLEPETPGRGLCFHRAVALLLDADEGVLCVGVLRGAETPKEKADATNSPVPFIHCWVELGDRLYAPTTIERAGGLYPFNRAHYYDCNGVRDVHRIPLSTVKALAKANDWYVYFMLGIRRPDTEALGTIVLDTAGIPYTISDRGGVIPA